MKISITVILLSLLSTSVFAEADSASLSRIKAGDKISFSIQTYEQEGPFSPPVLKDKLLSSSYTIDSSTEEEHILKYSNGTSVVLGKDHAFIASINKNGERKNFKASAIQHWMPASELKSGMKWSFETLWASEASNASDHMCQFDGAYKAVSSDAERDVKINDKLVHLNVSVIDIEGRVSIRTCEGSALHTKEHYVYSKDLDLVIEHELLQMDPFGKMLGGAGNNLLKVVAITTSSPR